MAALAEVNQELHLVVLDLQRRILHSIRHHDGTWDPFGDVMNAAGSPGTLLFNASLGEVDDPVTGELRLFFVGVGQGGVLWLTIRDRSGNWTAIENLNEILGGGPFLKVSVTAAPTV